MDTATRFRNAVSKFSKKLTIDSTFSPDKPEEIADRLFSLVVSNLVAHTRKEGRAIPKAEETAAELIRLGVPKKQIRASYSHIDITLRNARFFLYRSDCIPGSIQVDWNGHRCYTQSTVASKDLARTILDLDELLPKLEDRQKALIERIMAERKAMEIQRTAVRSQLEAVLPAMGISCSFAVKDGKVQLQLNQAFQGTVDLSMADLAAFLANPERILSILRPAAQGFVEDADRHYCFRGPTFRFP